MKTTKTLAALAVVLASCSAFSASKPQFKPLDLEKSTNYIARQGGILMPKDNGKRILLWDATGKAGEAITAFTNADNRLWHIPVKVKGGELKGCAYKAAKGVKSERTPAVIVVSEAGKDIPALSVYPEEAIACVNASALADTDPIVFKTRLEKEIFRAFGFALGGYSITRTPCVMDLVYSIEDLDANQTVLPSPMRFVGIGRAAKRLDLPALRPTFYSMAVRQGWAPAPTNDVQKAIWEKNKDKPAPALGNMPRYNPR